MRNGTSDGWRRRCFLPARLPPRPPRRSLPDFAKVRQELEQHRELTIELLWEEYRQQQPDGYCYSRFCKLYRRWKKQQDVVLRQDHRPGEKLFLDWAGATISIHHRDGSCNAGAAVRLRAGRLQLHLRRSGDRSADGQLAQGSDERAGVL